MGTILQWNCRGLMNNHQEVCLLSQQYSPVVMCLQETHIADISKVIHPIIALITPMIKLLVAHQF